MGISTTSIISTFRNDEKYKYLYQNNSSHKISWFNSYRLLLCIFPYLVSNYINFWSYPRRGINSLKRHVFLRQLLLSPLWCLNKLWDTNFTKKFFRFMAICCVLHQCIVTIIIRVPQKVLQHHRRIAGTNHHLALWSVVRSIWLRSPSCRWIHYMHKHHA